MSKKISTSKEEVLKYAKKTLNHWDANKFTIRDIAERFDVSVGTIYNWFPSKEHLIVSIIQADWDETRPKIIKDALSKKTMSESIETLYARLLKFAFEPYSKDIDNKQDNYSEMRPPHNYLIGVVEGLLKTIFDKYDKKTDKTTMLFLSEGFLSCIAKMYDYKKVKPVIDKLIS